MMKPDRTMDEVNNNFDSDKEEDDSSDLDGMVGMMIATGKLPGVGAVTHGNVEGKRKPRDANNNSDFISANLGLGKLYFVSNKVCLKGHLERRFRMHCLLFSTMEAVLSGRDVFTEGQDATGKARIHARIKLIAAL